MKWLVTLLSLLCVSAFSMHHDQSVFEGPVALKVWKHWQGSWNVEQQQNAAPKFKLTRGFDGTGSATVLFEYSDARPGDIARVWCEGRKRSGEWTTAPYVSAVHSAESNIEMWRKYFVLENFPECLDEDETRIVGRISMEVYRDGQRVFDYSVIPMYVRGKGMRYWDNQIPPYSAHAGSGVIRVGGVMAGEQGWDTWDQTPVKPVILFGDLNTAENNASIGLHRHVENQEIYLAQSGYIRVENGVAPVASEIYQADRLWEEGPKGPIYRHTEEFYAQGGWIESRVLEPGQLHQIVPKPQSPDTVYFHGLRAVSDCVFWTLGARN